MKGPICCLCGHAHWFREPHIFGKEQVDHEHTKKVLNQAAESLGLRNQMTNGVKTNQPDTQREGRRVLKAKAARPDATRSASTEKPDPPTPPPAKAGKQTKADKARPGKPQTAPKAKKKGKKK